MICIKGYLIENIDDFMGRCDKEDCNAFLRCDIYARFIEECNEKRREIKRIRCNWRLKYGRKRNQS